MGYEIIRYRPEFKDGVLKLLESLWTLNPAANAACLEWKYDRNPYINQPLIYLALDRGRVVGMRGMGGSKWEVGLPRQQFVIPCACDLVIAADHRNRGVISQIMRFAFNDLRKRGTEFVFNLSASQVTYLNSLAMGWRSIGPLHQTIWMNTRETPAGRLKRLLRHWPFAFRLAKSVKNQPFLQRCAHAMTSPSSGDARSLFSRLDRNLPTGKRNRSQIVVEKSSRTEAMADLVERVGSDGRIRHVRDQEYFAWQFANPLRTFRFLYWGQSKLEGYLVLETGAFPRDGRHSTVLVSDWEATNLEVFEALMMTAIRLGEFDELVAWEGAVPRPARELLTEAGFRRVSKPGGKPQYRPTVLVRATGDNKNPAEWRLAGNPLLDASRWDVRPIYSL
jgi:GNAT superfamily N-acetyltransferase